MIGLVLRLRAPVALLCAAVLSIAIGCRRDPANRVPHSSAPVPSGASASVGVAGESASYTYDAAGNVLLVQSASTSQVAVTGFQPAIGGPGQVVTVSGSGFSALPSQNAVTLGGTPAAVQTATATSLSFAVPAGATTGPISVTRGGSTARSSESFTVVHGVVVTGFAPRTGKAGTPLAISGFNFDPVAAGNSVQVGAGPATPTGATLTSLQATVEAAATSGKVSVTAGGSTGTSEADFFVVPSSYLTTSVGFTRRAVPGGDTVVGLDVAGQVGLVIFDGSQGQNLSLYVSSNTFSGTTTVTLYSPSGAVVFPGAVASGREAKLVPPALPSSGVYTVAVQPASGATGSLHLQVLPDAAATLQVGGDPVPMTLSTGQNGRYTFTGNAGDTLGLAYPTLTTTPAGSVTMALYLPNGTLWTSADRSGPGSWQLPRLTTAGTYTLAVQPSGTASASLSLLLSRPLTGALATDGTPTRFQTARPGQTGRYTFSATAGQSFTVRVTSSTPFANGGSVEVRKPDGSTIGSGVALPTSAGGDSKIDLGDLPTTGTYSVVITLNGLSVGALDLSVIPQATGTLVVGDPPQALTLSPAQNGRLTFTGNVGDMLGLAYPTLAATPAGSVTLWLYLPNGTAWTSVTSSGPGSWQLPQLSTAGTYTLTVQPDGTSSASLSLLLSQPLTGTLATDGTPTRFQTARPGQTGRYTFSATAGQSFTLRETSTAAFVGGGSISVRKPDGSALGSDAALGTAGGRDLKIDLGVLSATGIYTVRVSPAGMSVGTVDLSVIPQAIGTLVVGDPPQALTLAPAQNARLTFTGNAGDKLAVGFPTLTTTPAGSVTFTLSLPNGTAWTSVVPNSPGSWQLPQLSTTGTYTLAVQPDETSSASLSLLLSQPLTGTLATDGTPTRFQTARPGQTGRYTFSATAGQSFTLRVTPTAAFVGGGSISVRKPDGSALGSDAALGTSGRDLKIDLGVLPTTGTYSVAITPAGLSVGTLDLSVIPQATDTLVVGDPPKTLSLLAAQNGRYTFTATTGDVLNLVCSALSTVPNGTVMSYTLYSPGGAGLASGTIYGAGTLQWAPLTSTGTHVLVIEPGGTAAATFALQLSRR